MMVILKIDTDNQFFPFLSFLCTLSARARTRALACVCLCFLFDCCCFFFGLLTIPFCLECWMLFVQRIMFPPITPATLLLLQVSELIQLTEIFRLKKSRESRKNGEELFPEDVTRKFTKVHIRSHVCVSVVKDIYDQH